MDNRDSQRPLRQLLPGPPKGTEPPQELSASLSESGDSSSKRQQPFSACEACRARKIRCDRARPRCGRCVSRRIKCEYHSTEDETRAQATKRKYTTVKQKQDVYEKLYHLLRSRPDDTATELMRRLRAGADVESLVRDVTGGDLLLQLAVAPDTQHQYNFPDMQSIQTLFLDPGNPYLDSIICKNAFATSPLAQPTLSHQAHLTEYSSIYHTPFHAAEIVEPRLDFIKASQWTNVSSDDKLMRKLLQVYFLHEYPFFTYFHKDYFLDDMLSGRRRFCSSLLVNAVLAAACHGCDTISNRATFWDPRSMGYQFLAETRRLWELELGKARITTVQAACIIHMIYNKNAVDRVGWSYELQATRMAQNMGLFSKYTDEKHPKWHVVKAMTAWGVFSGQAMYTYHFFKPPLCSKAPEEPLPEDMKLIGEIWIKYPRANTPIPMYFGHLLKATMQKRQIMNDIALRQFTPEANTPLTLPEALAYRSRLVSWYESLPVPLMPQNIVMPIHFQIHMHYHNVMLGLFKPFVTETTRVSRPIGEGAVTRHLDPAAIIRGSKSSNITLLWLYYSVHGGDTYGVFLVHFLMLIGFGILEEVREPGLIPEAREALRATLILCAKLLYEQGKNTYVAEAVFHVLHKALPPAEAHKLHSLVNINGYDEERMELMAQHVHSEMPINILAVTDDPTDKELDRSIRALANVSLDESDHDTKSDESDMIDGEA